MSEKKLSHIVGSMLIQSDAGFACGAGQSSQGSRNEVKPKTFRVGNEEKPYIPAVSLKRWTRDTMIEDTGWPSSETKAVKWNPDGNVSKMTTSLDPVILVEDDLFGYMNTKPGHGQENSDDNAGDTDAGIDPTEEKGQKKEVSRVKSVTREHALECGALLPVHYVPIKSQHYSNPSSYDSQALAEANAERFLSAMSKKKRDKHKTVWECLREFGDDFAQQAKELADSEQIDALMRLFREKAGDKSESIKFVVSPCSAVPYTSVSYTATYNCPFGINYDRVGVFSNLGDRVALEEPKVKEMLEAQKIVDVTMEDPYRRHSEEGRRGRVYRITDKVEPTRKERVCALLKAMATLRGGSRRSTNASDYAPKVLILAGMSCGNLIFNNLFTWKDGKPRMEIATFKEIVQDYQDRITTPIFVGIRTGYLQNEAEIREQLANKTVATDGNGNSVTVQVVTPIGAANEIGKYLP